MTANPDHNEQSWRSWLARHGPAVVLLARQFCSSGADAEDAVQEGFVRFWKSRDKANDATAYLFACVHSAAMDFSRSGRRRKSHETGAAPGEPIEHLFDRIEREELSHAVEAALEALPAEQREVLVMKIWGELTFAQIGAALEINPDTAASRYRYALARLQNSLRQEAAHE